MLSLQTFCCLVVNYPGINSPYGPVSENSVTLNILRQMMPNIYEGSYLKRPRLSGEHTDEWKDNDAHLEAQLRHPLDRIVCTTLSNLLCLW